MADAVIGIIRMHGSKPARDLCRGPVQMQQLAMRPGMERAALDQPAKVADFSAVAHQEHDVPPAGYSGRHHPPDRGAIPARSCSHNDQEAIRWPSG
jgi:hypothetical protein